MACGANTAPFAFIPTSATKMRAASGATWIVCDASARRIERRTASGDGNGSARHPVERAQQFTRSWLCRARDLIGALSFELEHDGGGGFDGIAGRRKLLDDHAGALQPSVIPSCARLAARRERSSQ